MVQSRKTIERDSNKGASSTGIVATYDPNNNWGNSNKVSRGWREIQSLDSNGRGVFIFSRSPR